jgi:hypothetical protein
MTAALGSAADVPSFVSTVGIAQDERGNYDEATKTPHDRTNASIQNAN